MTGQANIDILDGSPAGEPSDVVSDAMIAFDRIVVQCNGFVFGNLTERDYSSFCQIGWIAGVGQLVESKITEYGNGWVGRDVQFRLDKVLFGFLWLAFLVSGITLLLGS